MHLEADQHPNKPAPLEIATWMEQHRDELRILLELGAINWPDFASAFAQAGYQDTVGKPVTSQTAEFLWSALSDAPALRQ